MKLATAFISTTDYFEREKTNPICHEYFDGEIFPMSGGNEEYNRIALNIASFLRLNLHGSGYKTFIAEMKVKIAISE
ncbi:Uma2 family endonuclease [Okeania sp. SIO2B3]|uniref:Uma2 family endonuclease n=1 Tax=Okeania sp. SIO2B3 TaxID=2607784 RepID=UPI0013C204CD|nr:Uma2 family endonuclease [Okeania sp. SIO2B3]NET45584.1 Uma2 family endonuclease [Okeania sp. SIO2B3]